MVSFKEKLEEATELGYNLGQLQLNTPYSPDTERLGNIIWGYREGLYQQALMKVINGNCSPQAYQDLDMEVEEALLDEHLTLMREETKRFEK